MKLWFRHLSAAVAAFTITLGAVSAENQADPSGAATFSVFLRGQRIGSENTAVVKNADGWVISASGRMGPPLDFTFDRFIARYGPEWQTRSLEVSGQIRGQAMLLNTAFANGTATSDVVQAGQQARLQHPVSNDTVILPNNFYAAYEALALRLNSLQTGASIPVYVAPQAEVQAVITGITPRRMETPSASYDLRQFDVSFQNPNGPLHVEVWVDTRGRLARLAIPVASLSVVREDLTSVMARLDAYTHPRDEDVFIPANGFSLAATITPPENAQKPPVVILVSAAGPQDRDGTLAGIPLMGQIAGRLSDAGFFVVRYDKRGAGQTGGRIETVSVEAYSEDLLRVLDWVRRRKDVEKNQVAFIGRDEGGSVALLAGSKKRGDVKAIGLIATPGVDGRTMTLIEQRHTLDKLDEPEALKREKMALQEKVMDAAMTGTGWEVVPPELRPQAETPWFKSWLSFDPAEVVRRTNQPILILQGALDTETPPDQADRLEALARARGGRSGQLTTKVVLPGINHLLVPAVTGEEDEYPSLPVKSVAPEVTNALIDWLRSVFPQRR